MIGKIRVFQHGKGTQTRWDWTAGEARGTISAVGAGRFVDRAFDSTAAAKQFCQAELQKDRSAIFYLLQFEQIVDTILDSEFHRLAEYKSRLRSGLISTVIVVALSWWVFVKGAPFQSATTNLALAGGMTLLYVSILWSNNWNWIESLFMVVIILVMASLVMSAIKHRRLRREQREPPVALVSPQIPNCVATRGCSDPIC